MSRSIRIPFLADLLLVDDYATLDALDREPRIDRDLSPRGPLVNRYILRRTARLADNDKPWPAFLPRDAAGRVEAAQALAERLDRIGVEALADDPNVDGIAAWVAGAAGTRDQAAVQLQRLIGKLFADGYEADAQSWGAAETILLWTRGRPLSGLWLSLTGRLRAARDLLVARAGGDLICAHGTGIAIHNILDALERLKALVADPGTSGGVREESVAAQCLQSPENLLRSVSADVQVKARRAPLRPSSLVVVRLERATHGTADLDAMFHAGSWAACPAQGYVKVLMRAVLRAAASYRQASTTREATR